MCSYTLEIPDSANVNEFDLKMIVATKLYEQGKLSSGQAAKIVGISKRAFVELLGKYNVSLFGYGFNEIQEDLKNAG